KLADAIERKQGEARAVSLDTLVSRGPQPPAPAISAALLANFRSLPPGSQHALLSIEWPRIASPSVEPLVRSLAEGRSPLRDEALLRLYDLNPEQARRIAVERIRKADVTREMFQNPRALLLLPDRELPELDEALVGMLEQGKPVELLLSRYASAAGFARVRQFAESRPGAFCGPLLAYFFRIDPAYAAERRALARSSGWGGCSLSLAPNEDLLMSPALEKAAIDDLASPDPMAQRTAQSLLQNGGSAAAQQPLWEGFARLRGSRPAPMNQSMLEFGYVEALLKAAGWALTPPEVDRLMAACLTDNCRATVASERRALQTPLRITMMTANGLYASVGPFLLRSRRQLEEKIAQFPKGTSFVFERGYEGTWFREQRSREIRRILDASGMTAIIQPARP
ncbi:MAG TPA: hypothetical protein VG672_11150, partial [Bryobacteraceae bacterium]|nr:hypothetical protein [Bryobacteraceae bacterium]